MTNIIEQSFSVNLLILKFFGLYPSEKISRFRTVRACSMYIISLILVPSWCISYYISEKEIDTENININTFAFLSEALWDIMKLFPFLKNGRRLKKCVNYFGNPYFSPKTYQQKEVIDSCIYSCRRNTLIFLVIVVTGLTFWITKPLFTEEYFPIDIWLPINPRANLNVYYGTYVIISLAMAYVAIPGTTVSPLTGGMALHAATQIKILKDDLQNLDKDMNVFEKSLVECEETYNAIKQCVKRYTAILSFAKEFEDCFSTIIFSQVSSTVLSMCSSCLQLFFVKTLTLNAVLATIVIPILLMQLYFYCYYGTMLYEENNTLSTAVYMGKWYEYNIKSRKALILLMERSKVPLIIKAGKIIELSVNTFTTVLKRSYSLLAVFKNI